jgi:hypothetical protein
VVGSGYAQPTTCAITEWLIALGNISTNYQTLEMGFRDSEGKRIMLRDMSTWEPRIVLSKRMERIFRHGDISYAA